MEIPGRVLQFDEPFQMGRVVSRTFGTIGRNAVSFLVLAVIAVAPQVAIAEFLGTNNPVRLQPGDLHQLAHFYSVLGIVMLVAMVFGALLQAALVHGTVSDLNGKKASFGDCLGTGFRTFLPVIGLSIVMSVAVGFGFLLLVIGGIIMMLAWSVAVPVLVVEKTGVFGAFGRSAELTKGHRWAILGLFVLVLLLSGVLSAATFPLHFLLQKASTPFALAGLMAISGIHQVIVATISATGAASVYYELRQIKEGIGPDQLASVFD